VKRTAELLETVLAICERGGLSCPLNRARSKCRKYGHDTNNQGQFNH